MSATNSVTVFEPQQERSRRTREQLLAACERLLADRYFVDVSIKEIVAEAGSSAGSFYARFGSKHALLHALHERMHERALARVQGATRALEGKRVPPRRFAKLLVSAAVALHEENGGLLRAVLVESLSDPVFAERGQRLVQATGAAFAPVVSARGVSIAARARAIEIAMLAVMAVLDQELFYGEALLGTHGGAGRDSEERSARLERIAVAAMDLGAGARPKTRRKPAPEKE